MLTPCFQNGGTNCPACRGIATSVTPSRALQTMTEVLVKFAPSKARAENEKKQADDIYRAGAPLRVLLFRPNSRPPVNIPFRSQYRECLRPSPASHRSTRITFNLAHIALPTTSGDGIVPNRLWILKQILTMRGTMTTAIRLVTPTAATGESMTFLMSPLSL